jgi:hypothetical protein
MRTFRKKRPQGRHERLQMHVRSDANKRAGVLKLIEDTTNIETGRWLNWNFVFLRVQFKKEINAVMIDSI